MVAPIYSNKKGIYRDLYREIDSDNKKMDASQIRRPKKGIYVELYKQIVFQNNDGEKNQKNVYLLASKKLVKDLFSRISYFFSFATGEAKMLIVACMVVKKPINSYIENNLQTYPSQEQCQGLYYHDR